MKENFPWLILILVWALNFGISWLNARTVGLMWVETKILGGWQRFMAWMGAIMSASGFTWCYLIFGTLALYFTQPAWVRLFLDEGETYAPMMDASFLEATLSLGYLIIIPGILFSGLMILIYSLIQAIKRKDLASGAVVGWNTFAQIHNTYSAMKGIPEAWKAVGKFVGDSKGDGKGKLVILMIVLVIVCVFAGVMTTWGIINKYAGTRPLSPEASFVKAH